jgi:hypothetical protein
MSNNYYSGQGTLYVADRDAITGKPTGMLSVGNVPELTINIETTKVEHKESESGQRLTDLTIVTEKKGSFEFTLENLDLDNLALGMWGTKATVVGGSVTTDGDPITLAIGSVGKKYSTMHPKVSVFVLQDVGNTITYVLGTDYAVDLVNGGITVLAGGALDTATASASVVVHAQYTYAGYIKMDAFTESAAPTKWLRFEGINTVDGSSVIVDLFKAQFDPPTGYSLITEELGSVTMGGSLLADTMQLTGSKFFRQINV